MRTPIVVIAATHAVAFAGWLGAAPSPDPHYRLLLQAPPVISVNSVAVSPDGSLVAAAADGVRLYDARTGSLVRAIGDAGDRGIAFSPDGRMLAAAGFHLQEAFSTPLLPLPIYDVRTGHRVRTLEGHTEWETYDVAFSPDGELFASTGADKKILVWELAAGKLRHRFAGQASAVSALAFSPDSRLLAGGGGEKTIRVWDMKTGEVRRTLTGHTDWVCAVTFSPDGTTLASGSCDFGFHRGHDWSRPEGSAPEESEWRLWKVATGDLERAATESGRLLSLDFSPDGTRLACGIGTEVRLYELSLEAGARVVATHVEGVTSVAFSPDGNAIISGSHDHTVKRTSLVTGKEEWEAPGSFEQVNSIALSDDGSLLATSSSDGRFALGARKAGATGIEPGAVRLWDAQTGRLLHRLGDPADQFMAVTLSADRRFLVAGGGVPDGKGVVRAWDAATGAPLWSVTDHAAEVLAVAASRDGTSLASGSADGVIRLRDARTGSALRTMMGHERGATSLAFTPDGASLVCGAGDGTTSLWEVRSGSRLRTFEGDSEPGTIHRDRPISSIALSRDGETLVTCRAGVNQTFAEPVRIWDIRTGELKRRFSDPKIAGRPIALSPDGGILATGGKTVRLWDARTGALLRELRGYLKRTQSIIFSADGRLIFSGGSYGTTNAWEVPSGRHLVTLFAFPEVRDGALVDEWLAYHPEGYYDGSSGIDRFLAWRAGDELLTPESLGPRLRRRDTPIHGVSTAPDGERQR